MNGQHRLKTKLLPEVLDAVIVWADLDNYTLICDGIEGIYLRKFMDEYYHGLDDVIFSANELYGAHLIRREKFVGDGILILIPIPKEKTIKPFDSTLDPGKNERIWAVSVGLRISEEMSARLNQRMRVAPLALKSCLKEQEPLRLVSGVHIGRVLRIVERRGFGLRHEVCGTSINIACSLPLLDKSHKSILFISEDAATELETLSVTSAMLQGFEKTEYVLRHHMAFPFRYKPT